MRVCTGTHALEFYAGRTVYHIGTVEGSVAKGKTVNDINGTKWVLGRLLQVRDRGSALTFRWEVDPAPLLAEDAYESRAYFPQGKKLACGEAQHLLEAPAVGKVSAQCQQRFVHVFPSRAAALAHFGIGE